MEIGSLHGGLHSGQHASFFRTVQKSLKSIVTILPPLPIPTFISKSLTSTKPSGRKWGQSMMSPFTSLVNSATLKPATSKVMVLAKAVPFQRPNRSSLWNHRKTNGGAMNHATYGMKNDALVVHHHANIGMSVRAVVVNIEGMYAPRRFRFRAFLPFTSTLFYAAILFLPSISALPLTQFKSQPHPDSLVGSRGHLSGLIMSAQSFLGCLLTTQQLLLTHPHSIPT